MNKLSDQIIQGIEQVIKKLSPFYVGHGGSIEFVRFDELTGQVYVKLSGHCADCSMSGLTLQYGLAKELKQKFPQISEVVAEPD